MPRSSRLLPAVAAPRPLPAIRRQRLALLRSGVSRIALAAAIVAGDVALPAAAGLAAAAAADRPPVFSAAALRQRAETRATAASRPAAVAAGPAAAASRDTQTGRAIANLTRASAAVRAQLTAQADARARALAAPAAVANGLAPDALWPYPGAASDPALAAQGLIWQGAAAPVEAPRGDGGVAVTVQQTQPKAILTWQSFNIGKETTLSFRQRDAAGTPQRDWVALNRVVAGPPDPATGARVVAPPSRILGQLQADGEVYVLNQNGIIFGGSAQVNAYSLIAASLDIGRANMRLPARNAYFLDGGAPGELSFSFQYLVDAAGVGRGVALDKPANSEDQTRNPRIPFAFETDAIEGAVTVAPGAILATPPLQTEGRLGRITLLAPDVVNAGTLATADGQAILAGARSATLFSNDATTLPASVGVQSGVRFDPVLRGAAVRAGPTDFWGAAFPLVPGAAANGAPPRVDGVYVSPLTFADGPLAHPGTVVNSGLITAPRGNITIVGHGIRQAGTVHATTSVNAPGSIFLTAQDAPYAELRLRPDGDAYDVLNRAFAGSLTLAEGSVLTILADQLIQADGSRQDTTFGRAASFQPSVIRLALDDGFSDDFDRQTIPGDSETVYPQFATVNRRPDGQIVFAPGSLVKAPAATLAIHATLPAAEALLETTTDSLRPNIVAHAGAEIDVAGLAEVERPIEANLVPIGIVTRNELADSPLQRAGPVEQERGIVVDRRLAGRRSDGKAWFGTPLFDANSYVADAPLPLEAVMTRGGAIDITGVSVFAAGAVVSIAGGSVRYRDGFVQTTALLSGDGRHIFDIGRADPSYGYAGIAGAFRADSPRWGQSRTWRDLTLVGSRQRFERGYIEGADAGSLRLSGYHLFDASLDAAAVQGPFQRAGSPYPGPLPQGGTLDAGGVFADRITFGGPGAVNVAADADLAALTVADYLSPLWSASTLSAAGAADIRFGGRVGLAAGNVASGRAPAVALVAADADIRLPPGGRFSLGASDITVLGRITAPAGHIGFDVTAVADAESGINYQDPLQYAERIGRSRFTLGTGAVLDVAGLEVNDVAVGAAAFTGRDHIDGGSVAIATGQVGNRLPVPDVSSIVLAPGSLIDLSGGAYIGDGGRLAVDAAGVPLGRGGDLEIRFHPNGAGLDGDGARPAFVPLDPATGEAPAAERRPLLDDRLVLAGSIRSLGFQGGGRFTLQAAHLVLGGDGAAGGDQGVVNLPASFFTQGFGDYALTAVLTAAIAPDARIVLTQPQRQPLPGVSYRQGLGDATGVGGNIGRQRQPVDFSLQALAWVDWFNAALPSIDPAGRRLALSPTAAQAFGFGQGAVLAGDPGAAISLRASGQMTLAGSISAPGGRIDVRQRPGLALSPSEAEGDAPIRNTALILRPTAGFDVSGVFLADPLAPVLTGEVLPGGTVTLAGGSLIAQPGSSIRASGGQGAVDVLVRDRTTDRLAPGGNVYRRQPVTSDAGSIRLQVLNFAFGGSSVAGFSSTEPADAQGGLGLVEATLSAHPGGPGNFGGRLILDAAAVAFAATPLADAEGAGIAQAIEPGEPLPAWLPSQFLYVATPLLAGSGIDSLTVTNQDALASTSRSTGVVAFIGDATLAVDRRIVFDRLGQLTSVPAASLDLIGAGSLDEAPEPGERGGAAHIRTAHLLMGGRTEPVGIDASTWLEPGSLTFAGRTVDVRGALLFNNVERVTLAADGDIRLLPVEVPTADSGRYARRVQIRTAADLELVAAQIYPATAVDALIQVTDPDRSVHIRGNGGAAPAPLSAGGALTVSAARIVQEGVIRAPLGSLTLGVTQRSAIGIINPFVPFVATEEVILAPGSLTSVSATGLVIPYGRTQDLRDWRYTAASDVPLTAPPAKAIGIDAPQITLAAGATLDLAGGGTLQAYEWVPGEGGSRNVLTTATSRDAAAAVYAILPGYGAALAPVDLEGMGDPSRATDTAFNDFGRTVTLLRDVPGLAAGTYTLLPGPYATLPGAFRVQAIADTTDAAATPSITRADGGFIVAGRFGADGGYQESRSRAFSIEPQPVWRQYSEIRISEADRFFADRAALADRAPPRLPADAGRLTLTLPANADGDGRLDLGARLAFAPAAGGRGGQVDIGATRIAIVAAAQTPVEGAVTLTPADIASFQATSVLIGGVRSNDATGDRINVLASEVVVRGSAAEPLVNPELLLVARDQLLIEAGSVLAARGEVPGGGSGDLRVDNIPPGTDLFGRPLPPLSGDGAFLRLSAGAPVQLARERVTNTGGRLAIAADTVVDGGRVLEIESTLSTDIAAGATLGGRFIDITGRRIGIGGAGDAAGDAAGDVALSAGTLAFLANAEAVTLRGREEIRFLATGIGGDGGRRLDRLTLDTPRLASGGGGGIVGLDAATLVLANSAPLAATAAGGDGILRLAADTLVFTGGDRVLDGFGRLEATARRAIVFGPDGAAATADAPTAGVFAIAGDVRLAAPVILAAGAAQQTLRATGGVAIDRTAGDGAALLVDAAGGRLDIDAAWVQLAAPVVAPAGQVEVRARAGDLILTEAGAIDVGGFAQAFVDTRVVLPGGRVRLTADNGNIVLEPGALIDVAAAAGGDAGRLQLSLGSDAGVALLPAGSIDGGGGGGGRFGGSFDLASAGAVAVDALAATLARGGFDGRLAVASGRGDLVLSEGLRARSLSLVADGGRVAIAGRIDVSGAGGDGGGGRIDLYGSNGVSLAAGAALVAAATDSGQRGGQVHIGSGPGGRLDLAPGSLIDVGGGSAYGASGGTVRLRVAYADAGEQTIAEHVFGATLIEPTAVILEPYQRLDLEAEGGIIDAAADWAAIFARFTPATGLGAVTAPLAAWGDRFHVMPGLELVNGDPAINNGDITITADLDLAPIRYGPAAAAPGILTLRAAGDLRLAASLSDGFENATAAANLLSCADTGGCLSAWSYQLVAGARLASADPLAVAPLASFAAGPLADRGNVVIGALPTMQGAEPLGRNTIIRTGTGWIGVAAGGSGLGDRAQQLPGAAYALTAEATAAGYRVDPAAAILFLSPTAVLYTAGVDIIGEPGFVDDDGLASESYASVYAIRSRRERMGVDPRLVGLVANDPAFAHRGGDIRLAAPHGGIAGNQHGHEVMRVVGTTLLPTLTDQGSARANGTLAYTGQLFTPWLLGQGAGSLSPSGDGIFGDDGRQSARWVLTGAFQQGVAALAGGDVRAEAAGNIDNMALAVVSTYRTTGGKSLAEPPALVAYGGGRLDVDAGGDIGSLVALVDRGRGRIHAGGALDASYRQPVTATFSTATRTITTTTAPLGAMLFAGDASIEVSARSGIDVDVIAQPEFRFDGRRGYALDAVRGEPIVAAETSGAHPGLSLAYGAGAAIRLTTTAGDLAYTSSDLDFLSAYGAGSLADGGLVSRDPLGLNAYLPPTVRFAAARGDIVLADGITFAPAAAGTFEALAFGNLAYFQRGPRADMPVQRGIKMLDADPATMEGPLNPPTRERAATERLIPLDPRTPIDWRRTEGDVGYALDREASRIFNRFYVHANPPLHRGDSEPVRMVALTGDITSGIDPEGDGEPLADAYAFAVSRLYFNKPARIHAGRDIRNLDLVGHNLAADQTTSVVAGRDIGYDIGVLDADAAGLPIVGARGSTYTIGGPGQFLLQAGRDLALKPSQPGASAADPDVPFGVFAIADRINPYLPATSAELTLMFGAGGGPDIAGFIAAYLDPATAGGQSARLLPVLADRLSRSLTQANRDRDPVAGAAERLDAGQAWALFRDLPADRQRPFVQELFFDEIRAVADPALTGGRDTRRAYQAIEALFPPGAGFSGDFDMLNAVVRTEFGSGINLLGAGGRALIGGLNTISPLAPNVQGILTLRGGGISAYLDGDFNVFNSRVLTLQGGDVTIISGNGSIDAGRGRQTERFFPPLLVACDPATTSCAVDFAGLVTGAGIGTVATVPGSPAGDVFLLAPRGVIDAGQAGIRASGNLFVLAQQVLNTANVQVGGQAVGLPQAATVPVTAVSAAASAADQASQVGETLAAAAGQSPARRLPSIVTVEVLGYYDGATWVPLRPGTADPDPGR